MRRAPKQKRPGPGLVDPQSVQRLDVDFMDRDHIDGMEGLNEVHRELKKAIAEGGFHRADLKAKFDSYLVHMRDHFAREEVQMQETDFPAYQVHRNEHERTLSRFREVYDRIDSGDLDSVLTFVEQEFREWFIEHIATMDRVTAGFFMTGKFGD